MEEVQEEVEESSRRESARYRHSGRMVGGRWVRSKHGDERVDQKVRVVVRG